MDLENDKVKVGNSHHLWLPTGDTWNYEPLHAHALSRTLNYAIAGATREDCCTHLRGFLWSHCDASGLAVITSEGRQGILR